MRLLVIEDECDLCEDIAKKLRLSGYEVDTCVDGEAALELLAVERPADMTRVIIIGAAAVLLVLIITVGSIVRHKRAVRPAGKHGK